MKYVLYRLAELPTDQQAVYLRRLPKGESLWVSERARLDDPQALRYSVQDLFPSVWWGDLQIASDGSLIAGIYPGIRMKEDGSPEQQWGVFFYRSTDDGHSWQVQGRIPYQPDLCADAKGAARSGFSEPAFQILPDGSFLCVMRTTDGFGNGPMYAARSQDSGRTWSKPARIAPSGVLPRLLCLENGVTVLCSGRPGVQLRFSDNVAATRWSKSLELLPYEIGRNETTEQMWRGEVVSCGYTGLLATGPDRFLVIYSDFQHRDEAGEIRKAIKVREVTVVCPSSSP